MFVFSIFIAPLHLSYLKVSILKIVYYLSVKNYKNYEYQSLYASTEEICVSAYSVNLQDKISDLLKVKTYICTHST